MLTPNLTPAEFDQLRKLDERGRVRLGEDDATLLHDLVSKGLVAMRRQCRGMSPLYRWSDEGKRVIEDSGTTLIKRIGASPHRNP